MITDIFVIIEWAHLARDQQKWKKSDRSEDEPNPELNMFLMTLCAVAAFMTYRIVSSGLIYWYR